MDPGRHSVGRHSPAPGTWPQIIPHPPTRVLRAAPPSPTGTLLTKDHTVSLGPAGARLRAVHLINDFLLDLGDGVTVEDLDRDGVDPFILDNHVHCLPGDMG